MVFGFLRTFIEELWIDERFRCGGGKLNNNIERKGNVKESDKTKLHSDIMNLSRGEQPDHMTDREWKCFRRGHKKARHDAADLVSAFLAKHTGSLVLEKDVLEEASRKVYIEEVLRPPAIAKLVKQKALGPLGIFVIEGHRVEMFSINFVNRPLQVSLSHNQATGELVALAGAYKISGTLLELRKIMNVVSRVVHGLYVVPGYFDEADKVPSYLDEEEKDRFYITLKEGKYSFKGQEEHYDLEHRWDEGISDKRWKAYFHDYCSAFLQPEDLRIILEAKIVNFTNEHDLEQKIRAVVTTQLQLRMKQEKNDS